MALKIDPWSFPAPELDAEEQGRRSIVLGGGCFWCTEAVYSQLDGVLSVRPGYAGGTEETANYRAVCTGTTDHAEVIEVAYDAGKISLGQIQDALDEPILALPPAHESPGCAVEQAVNRQLDEAVLEARQVLARKLATISLADLAADVGPLLRPLMGVQDHVA